MSANALQSYGSSGKSWNYDSGDLFLPKEKPVVSDGQIEDLSGLQAGVHCTVLQEEIK